MTYHNFFGHENNIKMNEEIEMYFYHREVARKLKKIIERSEISKQFFFLIMLTGFR